MLLNKQISECEGHREKENKFSRISELKNKYHTINSEGPETSWNCQAGSGSAGWLHGGVGLRGGQLCIYPEDRSGNFFLIKETLT